MSEARSSSEESPVTITTTLYTRNMPHDATYWAPGANDGVGGKTYGAPVLIKCRWQDQQDVFRSDAGEELTSSAVAYVASEVETNGYLALGDETAVASPREVRGARQIKAIVKSPALRNDRVLHKAMLFGFEQG
jgi:hypothetical protein